MKLRMLGTVILIAFSMANSLSAQSINYLQAITGLTKDTLPKKIYIDNIQQNREMLLKAIMAASKQPDVYNMPIQPLDLSKFPSSPIVDPTKKSTYLPDLIPNGWDSSGTNRITFSNRIPQKPVPIP